MSDHNPHNNAFLELVSRDRPVEVTAISQFPFLIGRGAENGNHLSLRDMRVSRNAAAIIQRDGALVLEDRGQRDGLFVNGVAVKSRPLASGDRIRLGLDEEWYLVFKLPAETAAQGVAETKLRSILGTMGNNSTQELNGLKVLLEATSLMGSQLPLESVLATMLDHAIAITRADRGMLLEPDSTGFLDVKVARGKSAQSLEPTDMNPSRSVLKSAVELQAAVVNEDLNLAELNVQSAQSVVRQLLRSSVVIPLYWQVDSGKPSTSSASRKKLLGAVYLDSKRTSTFSALDRQILDALGAQAASILENARLIERERERQRLEQELSIARDIQQELIPHGSREFDRYSVTGIHRPCNEVGGDYFDYFSLPDGRLAVLIADVAGKGLGAALVTTMLQGALSGMTLGVDPVKVFNHLNQFLCERATVGRCATMFFGLFASDGTLQFVRAGHPTPFLLRGGEVIDLYGDGSLPIGLSEHETYEATTMCLSPNDTLLLYSDGITEAENLSRALFQEERLKTSFAEHGGAALASMLSSVLNDLEVFSEGASQSDDVTLLALRYRAPTHSEAHDTSSVPVATAD